MATNRETIIKRQTKAMMKKKKTTHSNDIAMEINEMHERIRRWKSEISIISRGFHALGLQAV